MHHETARAPMQSPSNDHRLSFNRGIRLPKAHHPRHNLVRQSDINQHHVVVRMVDDAIQKCNEFSVALNRKTALEHREL